MEKNYLTSIRHLFNAQQKLLPLPTHISTRTAVDGNIKCVLFDIYGTLLISSSGDIDKMRLSASCVLEAFSKCGIKIISPNPDKAAGHIIIKYKQTINNLQNHRNRNNTDNPEIDIREVWEILLQDLYHEKLIGRPWVDEVKMLAIYFEVLSNPVYPMPFMKEIILWLRKRKIPIGIVSNAQFYTPVIMNYFLNHELSNDENVKYFDHDLCIFSYREKLAKPDPALFEKPLAVCREKYNLQSHEILFVGNDMLKDIYPAQKLNMRTALFTGDARSLRLREETPELSRVIPDYTISSLEQIKELIP